MANLSNIQQEVLYIIQKAADSLRQDQHFDTVQRKSNRNDLVTDRDRQIEQYIVQYLAAKFPEAKIISEEKTSSLITSVEGLVFFVDPIDGTMNFVKCHDQFAIMIGVYQDGEPLFGAIANVMADQIIYGGPQVGTFLNKTPLPKVPDLPLVDSLVTISTRLLWQQDPNYQLIVHASSGLRVFGSSGIIWSRLVCGQQNLYISKLKPWDLAAGRALAMKNGIMVRNIDGSPINMLQSQTVIIGTKCATDEALSLINKRA